MSRRKGDRWMALLALLLLSIALASYGRDPKQRAAFRKDNPCPSTGLVSGRCPGYVVDHIRPLCAGGADVPLNMQWQELQESKAKDKLEWAECRAVKKKAAISN